MTHNAFYKCNFSIFGWGLCAIPVVYIYPVEPNLCDRSTVTDSILGEYMVDENTSIFFLDKSSLLSGLESVSTAAWTSSGTHESIHIGLNLTGQ